MSFDAERSEIEARWIAASIGLTLGYDGQGYDAAVNTVRLSIQSGEARQVSFGSPGTNLVRYVGVAFFEIYTAGGAGSVAARGYAETIKTAFINQTLSTVKCGIPYILSSRDDPPFYRVVLAVPFTRDAYEA
jgi:hypothetical protein